jgi:hypothetical protein
MAPLARRASGFPLVSLMLALCAAVSPAHAEDRLGVLRAIAVDIENLKSEFPQLREFSVTSNLHAEPPGISYAFHTHAPDRTGGWSSGVPNPDPDGIWFHIDIHDSDSKLQLHTQPMMAAICLGGSRISFLMLEGRYTRSLNGPILAVLRKHGARECDRGLPRAG